MSKKSAVAVPKKMLLPGKPAAKPKPKAKAKKRVSLPVTSSFGIEVRPMQFKADHLGAQAWGTDFLCTVSSNATGGGILSNYLNPSTLGNTRLSRLASTYERFRFTDVRLIWSPTRGSSAVGCVTLSFDQDIADSLPTGSADAILRDLLSNAGALTSPVWEPFEWKVPLDPKQDYLWISPGEVGEEESRVRWQGQVYVALNDCAASLSEGKLYIDWKIELRNPGLENFVTTFKSFTAGAGISTAGGTAIYGGTLDPMTLEPGSILRGGPQLASSPWDITEIGRGSRLTTLPGAVPDYSSSFNLEAMLVQAGERIWADVSNWVSSGSSMVVGLALVTLQNEFIRWLGLVRSPAFSSEEVEVPQVPGGTMTTESCAGPFGVIQCPTQYTYIAKVQSNSTVTTWVRGTSSIRILVV